MARASRHGQNWLHVVSHAESPALSFKGIGLGLCLAHIVVGRAGSFSSFYEKVKIKRRVPHRPEAKASTWQVRTKCG